jgi:hypothetical protein
VGFGRDIDWEDLLKGIEIAGMQVGFYPATSNGAKYNKHIMICG